MPLHERLRRPTIELPVTRPSHGLGIAVAFALLAAGFAFAMPRALQVSAEGESVTVEAVEEDSALDPDGAVIGGAKLDATEDDGEDDGKVKADNHGRVVSAAAHCDVKGKAHGALVSSIAQDKDATLEDVEAACAAAVAAAEAAATDDSGKHEPKDKTEGNTKEEADEPEAKPEKDTGKPQDVGPDDDSEHPDDSVDDSDDSDDAGDSDDTDDSDSTGDTEDDSKDGGKGHSKDKP